MPEVAFNAAIIGAGKEEVEVVAVPPRLPTLIVLSSSMGTLPATMRINSNNDFIRSIISLPPAAASSVVFFAFFFLSFISVELLTAAGGGDDDTMTKCDTSTPREVSSHSSRRGKADDVINDDDDDDDEDVVVVVVDDDDDKFVMASRREGKIVFSLVAVRGVAETELIVSILSIVGTGEGRER
jgi:hypothetical protein